MNEASDSTDADFALLQVNERLSENLSSLQIADVLDELLFNAMEPVVEGTNILESILVEVLPFTATNARRKFSSLESHQDFIDHLFSFMVVNKKHKMKLIKQARMERTLYFKALDIFEQTTAPLPTLMKQYITLNHKRVIERGNVVAKIDKICRTIGANITSIYAYRQKAVFWHYHATQFKQMICEKFVRLSYNEALKESKMTKLTISRGDLFRDLLVSTSKAIDKYDTNKGPITSYIKWWFKDAKTQSRNGHEYNTAFQMSAAQRKMMLNNGQAINNLTVELNDTIASEVADDKASALDNMIDFERDTFVQKIAVKADPFGFACLMQDIHYELSEQERTAMRETMTRN